MFKAYIHQNSIVYWFPSSRYHPTKRTHHITNRDHYSFYWNPNKLPLKTLNPLAFLILSSWSSSQGFNRIAMYFPSPLQHAPTWSCVDLVCINSGEVSRCSRQLSDISRLSGCYNSATSADRNETKRRPVLRDRRSRLHTRVWIEFARHSHSERIARGRGFFPAYCASFLRFCICTRGIWQHPPPWIHRVSTHRMLTLLNNRLAILKRTLVRNVVFWW